MQEYDRIIVLFEMLYFELRNMLYTYLILDCSVHVACCA